VNDLLAQRKEIKRLERERESAERDKEEVEGRLAEQSRERELREFEMVSVGLEERKRKLGTEKEEEGLNGDLGRKRKRRFELDEEEMARIARDAREKVQKEIEQERVRLISYRFVFGPIDACSTAKGLYVYWILRPR
jgi:nitric oxide synthase-interacting protein